MEDLHPHPSQLLREARRRAGLTQKQLAIRAGTQQSTVSRIETGQEEPTIRRLRTLLWVMGFDLQTELQPRALAADPNNLLFNLELSADERAAGALELNSFTGELAEAGRRARREELAAASGDE